jgi:hypothetical protein
MQVEIEKLHSELQPLKPSFEKSDKSDLNAPVILINETEQEEGTKTGKKSLITVTNRSRKHKTKVQ